MKRGWRVHGLLLCAALSEPFHGCLSLTVRSVPSRIVSIYPAPVSVRFGELA